MFLAVTTVLVVFGGVSVLSLLQHRETAATLRLLHEGYLPLLSDIVEAKATQAQYRTMLEHLESGPPATQSWLDIARRFRPMTTRRLAIRITEAEKLAIEGEDRASLRQVHDRIETVAQTYGDLDRTYDALFDAVSADDSAREESVLNEIHAKERSIENELREAHAILKERVATMSARAADQERRAAILIGALAVASLLVGIVVLIVVLRLLSPLPRLERRVEAVARGDLSPADLPRSNDELGRLASAFEEMVAALGARDARLRDAAEAELRLKRMQELIVTNLSAAIVVVDGAGEIKTVNPAAQGVLGLDRDAVGRGLAETGLLERLPALANALEEVRAGAEHASRLAVPLRAEGDEAVNLVVTSFVSDEPGRSLLVVAEDVTEDLRTKARLIQTERLAAIGRMAAHVTHEVRNPLSSIGLNVEMLGDEIGSSPEARALLGAIEREIDRLTNITQEYLRLARLPDPRLELEDLGAVVDSVGRFVLPEMVEAKIELLVRVEEGLPAVAIDEGQVRQALLNLLRNAREAMPEGGRVDLEAVRADGGVRVSVRDRGPGIEPEIRARIFDLFYTTKERGTGLGLPLTYQIVTAHGGRIECNSDPDDGTTFELWFPPVIEPSRSEVSAAE
jgi:PAS domain S-box-containing protein